MSLADKTVVSRHGLEKSEAVKFRQDPHLRKKILQKVHRREREVIEMLYQEFDCLPFGREKNVCLRDSPQKPSPSSIIKSILFGFRPNSLNSFIVPRIPVNFFCSAAD